MMEEEGLEVLVADPVLLDFELVPIYDTRTESFKVTNCTNAPVKANLIACHEQWLRDFPPDLLVMDPAYVVLEPMESQMVSVSVRPVRPNIQNFYIIYEVVSNGVVFDPILDGGGEYEMEVHDNDIEYRHLLDITFIGDHALFNFTDILFRSNNPVWDTNQCWRMFSLDLLNQLLNPYSHMVEEGVVPQIHSVSFRFPFAPIGSEPSVLQLQLSNSVGLKGNWEICLSPPTKIMKKFAKLGDNARSRMLKSKVSLGGDLKDNAEFLALLWGAKFSSEERKCRKGSLPFFFEEETRKCRQSAKQEQDTAVFEVSPLGGQINEKESEVITLKCTYDTIGYHQKSVLFRILPATFVWIDLSTKTLGPKESSVQLLETHVARLKSVCLSDMDPPIQVLWMYNGGNVPASYSVDNEVFQLFKKDNFGHLALECLTTQGVIGPRSWGPIKLRFSPIEYTDYVVPLSIKTPESETPIDILLHGTAAFTINLRLRPESTVSRMRTFFLMDEHVPASVHPAQITFPHFVPTGQRVTTCVFLTNTHPTHSMTFRWTRIQIEGGGYLRCEPPAGRLGPKEETTCRVILQAGNTAITMTAMIKCFFEDETLKLGVGQKNSGEKDEQSTEPKKRVQARVVSRRIVPKPKPKPIPPLKAFSRLLSVSVYIGTVFGLYDSVSPKEKSRMSVVDPISVNRPVPPDPDIPAGFILTSFQRQMFEEIISDILLDIFSCPGFLGELRENGEIGAPLYNEYKKCLDLDEKNVAGAEGKEGEEEKEDNKALAPQLLPHSMEEIIEATLFNLIQEINTNYINEKTRRNFFDLAPLQSLDVLDRNSEVGEKGDADATLTRQ